ncbi:hypothetical protein LCGC14_2201120, partial [marine sediment metagenome]
MLKVVFEEEIGIDKDGEEALLKGKLFNTLNPNEILEDLLPPLANDLLEQATLRNENLGDWAIRKHVIVKGILSNSI